MVDPRPRNYEYHKVKDLPLSCLTPCELPYEVWSEKNKSLVYRTVKTTRCYV